MFHELNSHSSKAKKKSSQPIPLAKEAQWGVCYLVQVVTLHFSLLYISNKTLQMISSPANLECVLTRQLLEVFSKLEYSVPMQVSSSKPMETE